jgi:hypothetical protein
MAANMAKTRSCLRKAEASSAGGHRNTQSAPHFTPRLFAGGHQTLFPRGELFGKCLFFMAEH